MLCFPLFIVLQSKTILAGKNNSNIMKSFTHSTQKCLGRRDISTRDSYIKSYWETLTAATLGVCGLFLHLLLVSQQFRIIFSPLLLLHSFAPTSDKRLNLLCIYLFLLFAGECFGHKLEINVLCCVWVICPIYDRIMWRSEPWVAGINYMSLKLCTTSPTTRGRICIKLWEHTNFYGAHPLHFGI